MKRLIPHSAVIVRYRPSTNFILMHKSFPCAIIQVAMPLKLRNMDLVLYKFLLKYQSLQGSRFHMSHDLLMPLNMVSLCGSEFIFQWRGYLCGVYNPQFFAREMKG